YLRIACADRFAIAGLERGACEYVVLAGALLLVDCGSHRAQPGPAIGISQSNAGSHLLDVAGTVQSIGIGKPVAKRRGERLPYRRFPGPGDTHHDDDHAPPGNRGSSDEGREPRDEDFKVPLSGPLRSSFVDIQRSFDSVGNFT